jgi:putative two-component system response regulator
MSDVEKATILIVDDTADNLKLMWNLLKNDYKVKVVNNGADALKIAYDEADNIDLILLDVMMPNLSGYEVCQCLKVNANTQHIPVIFLTAKNEIEDETKGFELGAVDYISKPIHPLIVVARVKTHISVKKTQDLLRNENSVMTQMKDFLSDKNSFLEFEIEKRTVEVAAIQDVTIHALASLAETRDSDTGNHIRRTQQYVKLLAENLRFHPRFSHFLDDDAIIETLFKSAPLHDIGKVGIPDKILLKPSKFEPHEFEIMKTHPALGRDAILQAEKHLGIEVPFLKYAKEIAYYHHEKWDGSGYPEGLAGEAIPISARLMAVADVYDSLISQRIYKAGMAHEKAVKIIAEGKNTHFDPDITDVFLALQNELKAIAAQFQDSDDDIAKKIDYFELSFSE